MPGTIYSIVKDVISYIWKKRQEPFIYRVAEEVVTFEEKMKSLRMDVVKVNAHDHIVGIQAEYAWAENMYPGCRTDEQSLMEYEVDASGGNKKIINFDVLHLVLANGRQKDVYFEIESFFAKGKPSSFERGYADQKILDLYSKP